mmetsp:Transcript_17164/g.54583  ORF Transcript_17164/g.54583 Transcript_17164/m.54583 type:complete len:240 (-) Transcript_17164:110-829(-)
MQRSRSARSSAAPGRWRRCRRPSRKRPRRVEGRSGPRPRLGRPGQLPPKSQCCGADASCFPVGTVLLPARAVAVTACRGSLHKNSGCQRLTDSSGRAITVWPSHQGGKQYLAAGAGGCRCGGSTRRAAAAAAAVAAAADAAAVTAAAAAAAAAAATRRPCLHSRCHAGVPTLAAARHPYPHPVPQCTCTGSGTWNSLPATAPALAHCTALALAHCTVALHRGTGAGSIRSAQLRLRLSR